MAHRPGYNFWRISAGHMIYLKTVKTLAEKYARGEIIDIGSGTGVYEKIFLPCGNYHSLDIKDVNGRVSVIGNFEQLPLKDSSLDTAVSFQVLQYVQDIQMAVREVARVLRKEGYFFLGVPHICYLNNEPYDYWRFTEHGLKYLFKRNGLEVVEVHKVGGWFSFNGWLIATICLGLLYEIPIIRNLAWYSNLILQYIFLGLDRLIPTHQVMPLNYLIVCKKNSINLDSCGGGAYSCT